LKRPPVCAQSTDKVYIHSFALIQPINETMVQVPSSTKNDQYEIS
jgi:hypothetical protein